MSKKNDTPEQDALLQHQGAVNAAKAQLEALQNTIAQQESTLAGLQAELPDLSGLAQQHEDLLAEVATGTADSAALDDLTHRIAIAEAKKADIVPAITRCQQTIAGLQRKVADQAKALEVLKERIPYLVRDYLLSVANNIALAYLEKAKAIIDDYQRFEAIALVLHELGHRPFIRPHNSTITLPAYGLPAFAGKTLWQCEGLIYKADKMTHVDRRAAASAEADRIRALGIDFDKFE